MKKFIFLIALLMSVFSFTAPANTYGDYTADDAYNQFFRNRGAYFSYLKHCEVGENVDTELLNDLQLFGSALLNLRIESSIDTINSRHRWIIRGETVDPDRVIKEQKKATYDLFILTQLIYATEEELKNIDLAAVDPYNGSYSEGRCNSASADYRLMTEFIKSRLKS